MPKEYLSVVTAVRREWDHERKWAEEMKVRRSLVEEELFVTEGRKRGVVFREGVYGLSRKSVLFC